MKRSDPMQIAQVYLCVQRIELEAERQKIETEREEIFGLIERQALRIQVAALELWNEDQLEKIGGKH